MVDTTKRVTVLGRRYLATQKILSIFGSDIIALWMQDERSGTTSYDSSGNNYHGTYNDVQLANINAPWKRPVSLFNGTSAYNHIWSAGLRDAFNPAEGSLSIAGRVANAGVWTDGITRRMVALRADAQNRIMIGRPGGTNNFLVAEYRANNVAKERFIASTTIDFFHIVITWSVSNDRVIVYYNGAQSGAALNALGVWAGNLATGVTCIGSEGLQLYWAGWLGIGLLTNREISSTEVEDLFNLTKITP